MSIEAYMGMSIQVYVGERVLKTNTVRATCCSVPESDVRVCVSLSLQMLVSVCRTKGTHEFLCVNL